MLLCFDVGNTSIIMGVYENESLVNYWYLSTTKSRSSDEFGVLFREMLQYQGISPEKISASVISSVVPPLTGVIQRAVSRYFKVKPLLVGPGIKTGISIRYESPREVGADRIVNAVAGYNLYGGPLIIVDFGTATTFCVISEKGEYLGGVIAPGMEISLEALCSGAAKLPRIELKKPPQVVGKNTTESMQSGFLFGFIGMVKEIIERIKKEKKKNFKVVATGEMAQFIAAETSVINCVDTLLTLKGLKLIYHRNK